MKKDFEEIEYLKGHEVNKPKHELMAVMETLEELGAIREAKSLGTIIAKLEAWQHK